MSPLTTNPCAPGNNTAIYTSYQASVTKFVAHGEITIRGRIAGTLAEAEQALAKAQQEYIATGAWGGPG